MDKSVCATDGICCSLPDLKAQLSNNDEHQASTDSDSKSKSKQNETQKKPDPEVPQLAWKKTMSLFSLALSRDVFVKDFLPGLMETPHWKELLIADPADGSRFCDNLVTIFQSENFEAMLTNVVQLRIAVACAAVFCNPVVLLANQYKFCKGRIENPTMIERYRFVWTSYQNNEYHKSNEDIKWTRTKYPKHNVDFASMGTKEYIEYISERDGISVHDPGRFYDDNTMSMKLLHEKGGVCGALSKVTVGICQAFGIPAIPIKQPGHCAVMWLKLLSNTSWEWILSNKLSPYALSSQHSGIKQPWSRYTEKPWTVVAMDQCLKNRDSYVDSIIDGFAFDTYQRETSGIQTSKSIAAITRAIERSPWNIPLWIKIAKCSLDKTMLQLNGQPYYLQSKVKCQLMDCRDEDECLQASKIVSGAGTWLCKRPCASLQIDMGDIMEVDSIEIHWWGRSEARKIIGTLDGTPLINYQNTKPEWNEPVFNVWQVFHGFKTKGQKILLSLDDGCEDIWGMKVLFGIRQIRIKGKLLDLSTKRNILRVAFSEKTHPLSQKMAEVGRLAFDYLDTNHF